MIDSEDAFIPRTAAQVAPHVVFDLFLSRRRIVLQQRLRRQDHPGRAEAALQPAVLDKGLLNGMQGVALGPPSIVNSAALRASKASMVQALWTAVEQHSTGAADLHVTGLFRARQAEPIANEFDQRQVGLNQDIMRMSIDRDVDGQHRPVALLS